MGNKKDKVFFQLTRTSDNPDTGWSYMLGSLTQRHWWAASCWPCPPSPGVTACGCPPTSDPHRPGLGRTAGRHLLTSLPSFFSFHPL